MEVGATPLRWDPHPLGTRPVPALHTLALSHQWDCARRVRGTGDNCPALATPLLPTSTRALLASKDRSDLAHGAHACGRDSP